MLELFMIGNRNKKYTEMFLFEKKKKESTKIS